jgi:NAD-dependent deacetylase
LPDLLHVAAGWVREAVSVAALTGAGVSAESGVPTFRGKDGLWRTHRAEDLATPAAFARDPLLVWEWYRHRQRIVAGAAPNAAHHAFLRLEQGKPGFTLLTQNVDGLHRRAGSEKLVELHGNLFRARSPSDGCTRMLTGDEEDPIPLCPHGHRMRPDVVWFGEALPREALAEAERASLSASVFLVVGTSAVVYPAASFAALAEASGARIVEINVEETPITASADVSLRGKAAEILPALLSAALSEPERV